MRARIPIVLLAGLAALLPAARGVGYTGGPIRVRLLGYDPTTSDGVKVMM